MVGVIGETRMYDEPSAELEVQGKWSGMRPPPANTCEDGILVDMCDRTWYGEGGCKGREESQDGKLNELPGWVNVCFVKLVITIGM